MVNREKRRYTPGGFILCDAANLEREKPSRPCEAPLVKMCEKFGAEEKRDL